jgi:hypothetical protein
MPIETMIQFGIGFFFGSLIWMAIALLRRRRAVRLIKQRLEADVPGSTDKIQADNDLAHSPFATRIGDLEKVVEQLTTKTANQLAELNKKEDAINRLRIELDTHRIEIATLEAQVETIACSTKMIEHSTLVPIVPMSSPPRQEDTWTRGSDKSQSSMPMEQDTWIREELMDNAPLVPAGGRSNPNDTWVREENKSQTEDHFSPISWLVDAVAPASSGFDSAAAKGSPKPALDIEKPSKKRKTIR